MLALRWLALGATLYLSLHHWMRAGYWEFSGAWQYGLVLLDPRVSAALVWWVIRTAFLAFVLLPAAEWLTRQLPTSGRARAVAAVALAIGLGTRGIVGPLIARAAVAAPATLLAGDGEQVQSWLTHPYAARWLVMLTEAWWLLPFLVLALHLTAPTQPTRAEGWRKRGLLALFALLQSVDAPYLLTAGGPHRATSNLQLIALQEGWGRQEFGYASAIAVLLCFASMAGAWLLPTSNPSEAPLPAGNERRHSGPWIALGALCLAPLAIAALRRIPWSHEAAPVIALLATLGIVAAAAMWTAALGVSLPAVRPGFRSRLARAALLFPFLILVLPLVRPLGVGTGVAALSLVLGMVCLAPYLGLSAWTAAALRARGATAQSAFLTTAVVVAWATWTDLTLPLLLSQRQEVWLPLQGWMLWDLATHLRPSPLSVPGWSVIWLGGSLLAGFTAFRLLGLRPAADSGIGASPVTDGLRSKPDAPSRSDVSA